MINSSTLKDKHKDLIGILNNIFNDNMQYVTNSPSKDLLHIERIQTPRATVVACSDSRVQSVIIDDSPINDLFFVRNIGNYSVTGSVDYGIRQLNTPLLLIMGHVGCGAIAAKISENKITSDIIRDELNKLHVFPNSSIEKGVIDNIHYQVSEACKHFSEELESGDLMILGTIYDFTNQYNKGYHRLIVVNCNGNTDPEVIAQNPYLKKMKNIAIGISG